MLEVELLRITNGHISYDKKMDDLICELELVNDVIHVLVCALVKDFIKGNHVET